MKKILIATLTGFFLSFSAFAQTVAKGYVFEDLNGNGKKDKNEKGIANVNVSNGRDVTSTDNAGRYALPVSQDDAVFVIKPSGYRVPLNKNNLPQYYYLYKPSGSPKMSFAGVSPTGAMPASIDFPITRSDEKKDFTMLVFGDPQAYNNEELEYFKKGIIPEVAGIKNVAFGISLGDLVGNIPSLFQPYAEAVSAVGIPWYNVMGNHDMNFDAKADSLSDESFESVFGPSSYAFNYADVHFIVLDDILYPDPRGKKGYWGGLTASQKRFVENDLKYVPKDKLVVLAFHIPFENVGNAFRKEDRDFLFNVLKDFPHTFSMSAHTHNQAQFFYGNKEGWLQAKPHHHYNAGTTSGNWYSGRLNSKGIPVSMMSDGTPKGYSFINFSGTDYTIDYKVADRPKEFQINIFAPKVVEQNAKSSSEIVANFFMGKEGDEVLMRINDGPWKPMVYSNQPDPFYTAELQSWDMTDTLFTGRRPGSSNNSTHIWKLPVKTNVKPGRQTVEVKATDMFGRTHLGKTTYTVLPKR